MSVAIEVGFKGRRLAYFVNPERVPVGAGDHVIVEAERGIDMGEVRHIAVDVTPTERDKCFRTIVRRARPSDFRALERVRAEEAEASRICRDRIRKLGLEMKLVDSESQIDGNRITFYFTAEKRVDFRELVKELAGIFKTRIELRQIGARDAAKRLGGIGPCGREYCCSTWLKDFSPVTLKMAKNQGLALAPSKISGGCGRLMCCLMYEDPFYKEMVRLFPKPGLRFDVDGTPMRIFQNDFFREIVRARDEEGNVREWTIEEFPVSREQWGGAVRAKGAPTRGGSGSGCHKPDPKPIGMSNARGRRPKGKIPIQRVDENDATGAPFMHGGRERPPREPDAAPPPPAEMVRFEAQRRRREDGDEIGSGPEPPAPRDFSEAELVAAADPEDASPRRDDEKPGTPRLDAGEPRGKDTSPVDAPSPERRPRSRRRRRNRRRRSEGEQNRS